MPNKKLWDGVDGIGIYAQLAKHAIKDANGNVIDSTYATKEATDALLADKVDKVSGKGLSANDYTDADKGKLDGITAGAQPNIIESISVNNTEVTPDANKNVNIVVPNAVPSPTDYNQMLFSLDGATWTPVTWESEDIDVPEDGVIIDGKRYSIVTIGDQQWMTENLAMPVGTINKDYRTTTEDGVELFFYAALKITNGNETMSDLFASKLPEGWRIPTRSDFTKLATTVENNSNSLKSTVTFAESTLGWEPHQNTNPTNATGFNLKAITRFNGGVTGFSGTSSVLLSSTKSGNWYFYYCVMGHSYTTMNVNEYAGGGIDEAYPVRLVKDL